MKSLLHTDPPTRTRDAVRAVENAMTVRLHATDRSRIRLFREAHQLGSSVRLWRPVLASVEKVAGMAALMKMRIGIFFYGYRLAGAGIIDRRFLQSCPCCEENVREDAYHIFMVCSKWSEQRSTSLAHFMSLISNLRDEEALGVLLGGESHVDPSLRVLVTVASATYLSQIVPIRARLIDSLAN